MLKMHEGVVRMNTDQMSGALSNWDSLFNTVQNRVGEEMVDRAQRRAEGVPDVDPDDFVAGCIKILEEIEKKVVERDKINSGSFFALYSSCQIDLYLPWRDFFWVADKQLKAIHIKMHEISGPTKSGGQFDHIIRREQVGIFIKMSWISMKKEETGRVMRTLRDLIEHWYRYEWNSKGDSKPIMDPILLWKPKVKEEKDVEM